MRKTNEKGFTLVEVIVVALLLSILALGAFALFNMYSNAAREDIALMRMHRQSEAIMEEIAFRVRAAHGIFPVGEPYNGDGAGDELIGDDGVGAIILYDHDGLPQRGFSFGSGRVRMCIEEACLTTQPNVWNEFMIDGNPIETVPANSSFDFPANRVQISVRLELTTTVANQPLNLTVERGIFQCRRVL